MNEALNTAFTTAAANGLDLVTDNVAVLLAIPAAFVGLRVVRKLISKIA